MKDGGVLVKTRQSLGRLLCLKMRVNSGPYGSIWQSRKQGVTGYEPMTQGSNRT